MFRILCCEQDQGALSLYAKGNFNISELNDTSEIIRVSYPQYPLLLVNSPLTTTTTTTNINNI